MSSATLSARPSILFALFVCITPVAMITIGALTAPIAVVLLLSGNLLWGTPAALICAGVVYVLHLWVKRGYIELATDKDKDKSKGKDSAEKVIGEARPPRKRREPAPSPVTAAPQEAAPQQPSLLDEQPSMAD